MKLEETLRKFAATGDYSQNKAALTLAADHIDRLEELIKEQSSRIRILEGRLDNHSKE